MNTAQLSAAQLATFIDHTLLKPDATAAQIEKLCAGVREHKFFSVCVSSGRRQTTVPDEKKPSR